MNNFGQLTINPKVVNLYSSLESNFEFTISNFTSHQKEKYYQNIYCQNANLNIEKNKYYMLRPSIPYLTDNDQIIDIYIISNNSEDRPSNLQFPNDFNFKNSQKIGSLYIPKKTDGGVYFGCCSFQAQYDSSLIYFIMRRDISKDNVPKDNQLIGRKVIINEFSLYELKNLLGNSILIPPQRIKKVGVLGYPHTNININGELITLDSQGRYEIYHNPLDIVFLDIMPYTDQEKNITYIIDYVYEE